MSKLKLNNIKFDDDDFVVEIKPKNRKNEFFTKHTNDKINIPVNKIEDFEQNNKNITEEPKLQSENLINQAQIEAQEILEKAQIEKQELDNLLEQKKQELEDLKNAESEAQKKADEILEEAKIEAQNLKTQSANEGYEEGYKDAKEKIQEELEEKLLNFDKFCALQSEIREKILKNSTNDIIKIIQNIVSKILTKEMDGTKLSNIVKNTVNLFEDKEEINITLSENYAKLLYELQKKSLGDEIEFNFKDFRQYENFNVTYSPKFDNDTIIIENSKERFDASMKSQLDVIIRNIYDATSSKPFEFNLEENSENNETN